MNLAILSRDEMIMIVTERLARTNLKLKNPEIVARNLLSHFRYDLEKVLELAV